MPTYNLAPVTALDYRRLAERRLPRFLFDYIDGGCNQEQTMADNCSDFARIALKQRVMVNVESVSTQTTLLGQEATMPLMLAPVGMAGMMAQRGEVQAALAAEKAKVPYTLSTMGVCTLEEIHNHVTKPIWFQLYMLRDRGAVETLLHKALNNGCNTLVFTVDLPVPGARHRDIRNGMIGKVTPKVAVGKAWQLLTRPQWVYNVGIKGKPHGIGNLRELVPNPDSLNDTKDWIDDQFDPSVTWKDIEWLRQIWPGKLIIKGVMEADDALAAVDAGADALVVSNHGGRQLDGVASSIRKLPEVAQAVGSQTEVYVDGGIRDGVDVFKALALGAKGVMIGRPWIWAAAGAGEQGVYDLLQVFQFELETAMKLAGVVSLDQINADVLDGAPFKNL